MLISDRYSNTNSLELINGVKNGIEFIFSHFDGRQQLFPRKMSTALSNNRQFTVYNKNEVLDACIKADFMDCRINAYPVHSFTSANDGLSFDRLKCPNLSLAPSILFIDLDRPKEEDDNKTLVKLDQRLNEVLKNIHKRMDGCTPRAFPP